MFSSTRTAQPNVFAPESDESGERARVEAKSVDVELVAKALTGDQSAEAELYQRHAPHVFGIATRLLRNRDEAADVVQDTFVRALSNLHTLKAPGVIRAWLSSIAVREVHRRFRRKRLRRAFGFVDSSSEPEALSDLVPTPVAGDARAELALLDVALRAVGDNERIAWMLHRIEGHTLEQVAELVGCSLATVKRRTSATESIVRAHFDREAPRG